MIREGIMSFVQAIEFSKAESRVMDVTMDKFFDNSSTIEALAERFAQNPDALMVVHPFFGMDRIDYVLQAKYLLRLRSRLRSAVAEKQPIIVFEEEDSIQGLKRTGLDEYFLVRTLEANPSPNIPWINDADTSKHKRKSMDYLLGRMKNLGLYSAEVIGRNLVFDELTEDYRNCEDYNRFIGAIGYLENGRFSDTGIFYPNQCVGSVVKGLMRAEVRTRIGDAVWPRTYSSLDTNYPD